MSSKVFSQRFNQELAMMGLPEDFQEKTKAIAKVFGVSRHLANSMMLGYALPSAQQLEHIACILEVCPKWLSGVSDRKKVYSLKEATEA